MGVIKDLFTGGSRPRLTPPPPPPQQKIAKAPTLADARNSIISRNKGNRRAGGFTRESSIMTSALGLTGGNANTTRKTLLGL